MILSVNIKYPLVRNDSYWPIIMTKKIAILQLMTKTALAF